MAFFPGNATVYIGAADAAVGSCTNFSSYITNFSQSGGTRDTESIPVFGGGNVTKENPREQLEISFDCIVRESGSLLFDSLVASSTITGSTGPISYANSPAARVVYVEMLGDDGSTYHTRAYNNVEVVNFEPEMAADGYLQGTLTLKLSPTDPDGTTNVKIDDVAASSITW